jgi:hypothetical protein
MVREQSVVVKAEASEACRADSGFTPSLIVCFAAW